MTETQKILQPTLLLYFISEKWKEYDLHKTVKLDEKRKDVNEFIKDRMSYQIANFYW